MGEMEVKEGQQIQEREGWRFKIPSSVKVSMPSSCCIFLKISKARTLSAQAETLAQYPFKTLKDLKRNMSNESPIVEID